jgi:site-specific DNA-methyltransferase (adenine-specific)
MTRIPDCSIDLVITDPPYTMTKRGNSCRPNWMPNNMGDNVFDSQIPKADEWMCQCFRVLKESTHFYTFTNTNDLQMYLNTATHAGFKLHNVISMIKDTGMPNRWYYKQTELILFFRKGKAKPINDYTSRDNIHVTMPKKRSGKLHIAQKPLPLIELLVTNSSIANEIVLDPFMGSGTTGLACVNKNRRFLGIELDIKHFNTASTRLLSPSKQPRKLFGEDT